MGELKTAIQIRNLSGSYGSVKVLDDVSADIGSATLTMILGCNGSGKSTLLRLLSGLITVPEGCVFMDGKDLHHLSLPQRAKVFGFLGQKHKAVFPFSVAQVVLTGRAGHVNFLPGRRDEAIVTEVLQQMEILHLKDRRYTELSGGEQQLVMLARALAQEAKILLLDEPTTHLDFSNQIRVLTLLKRLTGSGITVVAVLHDPGMAFLYGDDFIFLHKGKLIRPAESQKPWDASFLRAIYGHELQSIPYRDRAVVVPY